MHPEHHLAALKAFFRRHQLALPPETPFSAQLQPIERYGLLLALARRLQATDCVSRLAADRAMVIDGERFAEPEWVYGLGVAALLSAAMAEVAAGRADHNGAGVDRIALIMLRLEQAGITVDADALAREGEPAHLIVESGLEAAQLAEAIKLATTSWPKARQRLAAASISEAA